MNLGVDTTSTPLADNIFFWQNTLWQFNIAMDKQTRLSGTCIAIVN